MSGEGLVERLRAVNEWLMTSRMAGHELQALEAGNCALEAATALTAAEARIQELEAALRPFADAADRVRSDLPDDCALLHYEDDSVLSLGQLRRARRTLRGE